MHQGSDAVRYAGLMLFGHQLTRWAASKICEDPNVTSPMIHLINDAQMEKSAEPFDFTQSMKDFRERQIGWILGVQREEAARDATNDKRMKQLAQRIKNKKVPLPTSAMESAFEDGMMHDDTLLLIGPREGYLPLLRLCAKKYMEAGGNTLTLLGDYKVPEDLRELPGYVAVQKTWMNTGDTFGRFNEMMKPFKNSASDPIGVLIVEDLDNLLAESPLVEPRPVRIVRALGLLRQYQAIYPMAMIIGINTEHDQPQGMRPEESYPPFITAHPYLEIDVKDSDLVAGSKNVILKLDGKGVETYTMSEIWKKVQERP